MENVHKESIRKNMVELVRDTSDAIGIAEYLFSTGIFTKHTLENIEAARTSAGKNRIVYSEIVRRGPDAYANLINALVSTGNGHLAYTINGLGPLPCVPSGMFRDLTSAVASLKPVKTTSIRSSIPVFKVAVNMYTNTIPKSTVGFNELPYVMAIYKGIPKNSVTRWHGCPSSLALDCAYKTYESEVLSARHFLDSLDGGAIDVSSSPTFDIANTMKVLEKNQSLLLNPFNSSTVSEDEKKTLAMKLHLITFGCNMKMIVRKDFAPKPSSYLCYNASSLSPIIKDKDREVVLEIMGEDESNFDGTETPNVPCPF